jgi:hypothetical protein
MLTRKAKLLLSLTAATPLFFAACTDNSLLGPYGDVAGTYQLTIYQNFSVPVTFTYQPGDPSFPSGGTVRWTDGTMELRANGTFREINNFIATPSGGASQSRQYVSNGTFTVNGNQFTLSAPQQNPGEGARFSTGTIDIDRINYSEDDGFGNILNYEYVL